MAHMAEQSSKQQLIPALSDQPLIIESVVNDLKVSAYHAQILPAGQGYDIIDLGSSNGTYVNGQRLYPNVPRLLTTGDQIRFGDISFFEARAMSQNPVETTVYGGFSPGNSPVSPSTATAASPSYGREIQYAARRISTLHTCTHARPF